MYWKMNKVFTKSISVVAIITFLFTNTSYAAPSSRSFFRNRKVDYKKLSTQREDELQRKKSIFKGGDVNAEKRKKEVNRVLSSYLKDLSQIHIPSELGRVIEVYESPSQKPLIVHIQDLHTNPEGQLNLARILELLIKDYKLDLVCSEGADGEVDTSSVSSFPDYEVREKVARIFVNSGELTGEEYLSITKYPRLTIWGIEDRDIYFKNIIQFNKIMKFSPSSQVFISQARKALKELKPRIYSKELLEIDQKETEYEAQELNIDEYLKYLSKYTNSLNIPTANYKNITLLTETMEAESNINEKKIMADSRNLLLNLRTKLSKSRIDSLMVKSTLFKDKKISPFSFYTYLKDLALKHIPGEVAKYKTLFDFVTYLEKVNSLDSTKLFNEMENLTYEIKITLAKKEEQKTLVKALRNIRFLEGFFNLKVSNEELDYYLKDKESFRVSFFKSFLTQYKTSGFIDFNPLLIDTHLQELEDFYKTVKDRDIAMVDNTLSEIKKRNAKVIALPSGGFHTKGITRLLRDKGYSYIVISPYSSTDIDEENYHFLLSGKRKPIGELLKELDLPEIVDRLSTTLRIPLAFDTDITKAFNKEVAPKIAKIKGLPEEELPNIADRTRAMLMLKEDAKRENIKKIAAPSLKKGQIDLAANFELLKEIPVAIEALSDRDIKGENVLVRVNLNADPKEDTTRLDNIVEIVEFLLKKGATPILFAHNGRLDKKKGQDKRQSLASGAQYIAEKLFPDEKVKFHRNSITDEGLNIQKSGIVPGAINVLENVRFADEYELGSEEKRKEFTSAFTKLSDGKLIVDTFADMGSKGVSIENIPEFIKEVFIGPSMLEEFELLEKVLQKGPNALIFGGVKPDKLPLLEILTQAAMNPEYFALIGSSFSSVLKNKEKDLLKKLRAENPERVIIALDYSGTEENPFLDIGPKTTKEYLRKLDALEKGDVVFINGTMGIMETDPKALRKIFNKKTTSLIKTGKFQKGTKAVNDKLKELARRGVHIVVLGGDAGKTAKQYGLTGKKNVITFTGGGVVLKILSGEILTGLKAISERQREIVKAASTLARSIPTKAKGVRIDILAQRITTKRGATTGEVYIGDAIEEGANSVLVGHSEARDNFQRESNRRINEQVKSALEQGIEPIVLCVGESAKEKEDDRSKAVVKSQILFGLRALSAEQIAKIIIAYEPKWAIKDSGYGKPAEPKDAQEMASFIRGIIKEKFGIDAATNIIIQYGGSADKTNARSYLTQPDVDGLLVGGKSTSVAEFLPIVKIAQEIGPTQGRIPYIGGNWKSYLIKDEFSAFRESFKDIDFSRVQIGIAPSLAKIRQLAQAFPVEATSTPAVSQDLVKFSRKQHVDSMDQIIVVDAVNVIADKEGFKKWISNQPENVAVVIMTMRDDYEDVSEYGDIAYIKIIGEGIKFELVELFAIYEKSEFFNGFKLGTPYSLDKYKAVIDEIASGV